MKQILESGLLLLNLAACALYGIDKVKAKLHAWRIPERVLLACGLLAPVGAGLGMLLFRHKIRKPRFYLALLAGIALWLLAYCLIRGL
ncbi:MAG: DUF1294 domain-containing protein [Lactobacillus sp.]|jgi:uncharacterized membrane protein YsdA (DUF1294 family)